MQRVINEWVKANGYLEKKNGSNLGDFTPAGKTVNAGENNYTNVAEWYKRDTGINCQGQPYCAMGLSEMFVLAYGLETARKLLYGSLYHYCPDIYNVFNKAGRIYSKPQKGDVILFHNGVRFHHVGQVVEVSPDGKRVTTTEANTSSANQVVANGGAFRYGKTYALDNLPGVKFARPNWAVVAGTESKPVEQLPVGWVYDQTAKKWWFRQGDGRYPKSNWYCAYCAYDKKYHWFLFDADGWMLTGRQVFQGKKYYLEDSGPLVGACMVSDGSGALGYLEALLPEKE